MLQEIRGKVSRHMTHSRSWALGTLAVALITSSLVHARQVSGQDEVVRRRLAGEWTLVKYEVFPENGATRPGNYDVGRINYGEHEMSAHLMRSGRQKEQATTEATRALAFQGYLGYFGPYTIDAQKKTVTHHVVGSSLPNWAGSEQVRHYAFSNDGRQLMLSLKSGDRITQTLTWERTRP